jgi:hypothetical protein
MKKIRKRSASWLAKSARRGFRGYPIATVALYGPTADLATKIAVSIIPNERKSPHLLERWFFKDIDVRHDPVVGEQIQAFLRQHQARSVVVPAGVPRGGGDGLAGGNRPGAGRRSRMSSRLRELDMPRIAGEPQIVHLASVQSDLYRV